MSDLIGAPDFTAALEDMQAHLPAWWRSDDPESNLYGLLSVIGDEVDQLAPIFQRIALDSGIDTASVEGLRRNFAFAWGLQQEQLPTQLDALREYIKQRSAADGTLDSMVNTLMGFLATPENITGGPLLTFPVDGSGITFPAHGGLTLYQFLPGQPVGADRFPADGSGLLFPADGSGYKFVFNEMVQVTVDYGAHDWQVALDSWLTVDTDALARACERMRPCDLHPASFISATAPIPPIPPPLSRPVNTRLPSLTGDPAENGVLHTDGGLWDGYLPPTLTFQWQTSDDNGATWTDLPGETSADHTCTSADIDNKLDVVVIATNDQGVAQATSAASATIVASNAATPPVNVTGPVLTGTAQEGQTLTTSNGTWSGNPSPTFRYQWFRSPPGGGGWAVIPGETAQTYRLAAVDVGQIVMSGVIATNIVDSVGINSSPTATVTAIPTAPVNTVLPAVTGTAMSTGTLTSDTGVWTGNPTPTYAYQWYEEAPSVSSPLPSGFATNGLGSRWVRTLLDALTSADATLWTPYWFANDTPIPGTARPALPAGTPGHAANVTYSGGQLHLTYDGTNGALVSTNPGDGVGGHTGFEFTDGYLEVRFRVPDDGTGKLAGWPAIALFGQAWPFTQEEDVIEGLSGDNWLSLHYGPYGGAEHSPPVRAQIPITPATWHTIGIERAVGVVRWYLDNALVFTVVDADLAPPFKITNAPQYVAIMLSGGGDTLGTPPYVMDIESVQVFRRWVLRSGETASTLALDSSDVGLRAWCEVAAHNSVGDATAKSNIVGPIAALPAPGPTVPPDIPIIT